MQRKVGPCLKSKHGHSNRLRRTSGGKPKAIGNPKIANSQSLDGHPRSGLRPNSSPGVSQRDFAGYDPFDALNSEPLSGNSASRFTHRAFDLDAGAKTFACQPTPNFAACFRRRTRRALRCSHSLLSQTFVAPELKKPMEARELLEQLRSMKLDSGARHGLGLQLRLAITRLLCAPRNAHHRSHCICRTRFQ